VQQWLDLNADPESINDVLSRDDALRPLVESRPGMRVPTTVDPWETLIRAIVGQQVSVSGATTVLGRLVAATRPDDEAGLAAFPTADAVAQLGVDRIAQLGMPGARARTIASVAEAIALRNIDLRDPDTAALRSSLLAMPGLGPWTVDYVRMRGLGDPDAFPETDLILKQNAKRLGLPDNARALANYSRVWSPWRAYAAHHLWSLPKEQR
jgi:3-methyladenine DNA glycosylase/8-oxoguanine DNA glycosylase